MFSISQSSTTLYGAKVVRATTKSVKSRSSSSATKSSSASKTVRCERREEREEQQRQREEREEQQRPGQKVAAIALSLTMLAQPAFAANEIAQFAKGDSKATAVALLADYKSKKAIVQTAPKTKNLAGKSKQNSSSAGAWFSLPSFSLPSFSSSGGSSSAPKAAKAAAAPKEAGGGKLLGICFVLFSPLALVQFESVKTLARLAAQKADQK